MWRRLPPRILVAVLLVGSVIYAARPLWRSPVAEGERRPRPAADLYDPRADRGSRPPGYVSGFGRDDIRPIYDPRFVPADAVRWEPETLVLGIAIDGAAKAYPINVLNAHEMVIDRLRGVPLLVSW